MDLGFNDGMLLCLFKIFGMDVLGVEFVVYIVEQVSVSGIFIIGKFFDCGLVKDILVQYGLVWVIMVNNVFVNIDDFGLWVDGINILLVDDGVFVFESYYLVDFIDNMVFDFIYYEYFFLFLVCLIQVLFVCVGLELMVIEWVVIKGGLLCYFVQCL